MNETNVLYTVRQFIDKNKGSWPSESALRSIIGDARWGRNNFQRAFKRIGRRVLINEQEFWKAVNEAEMSYEKKDGRQNVGFPNKSSTRSTRIEYDG